MATAEPSPDPAPKSSPRPWGIYVAVTIVGLLLAPILLQLHRPLASIGYPYQLDAEEGFLLNQALRLRMGQSIYPTPSHAPFLIGNYPPLYPLLYAAAVGGTQATPRSLPIGRVLVALSALAATLLIALIAWERTRALWPALVAVLLWLSAWEVQHWLPFSRVDFPALAFTLGGLFTFLRAQRPRGFVAAGLLLVAAFYTRQTALLAPIACVATLVYHRDWRRLAWFALPATAAAVMVLLLLQGLTAGEYYRHTVTYNRNAMDWLGFRKLLKNEILFFHAGLLRLGALLLLARGVLWLETRLHAPTASATRANPALGLYALLALLSIVTYAKVGAAPNYMLEPLAVGIVWLAVSLHGLATKARAIEFGSLSRIARISLGVLLLALIAHAGRLYLRDAQVPGIYRAPIRSLESAEPARQIIGAAMRNRLRFFSEEPIFALLAGQPPEFQPFIMTRLAREGRWDERPWLTRLASAYDLLLVNEDLSVPQTEYLRYTPAMADTIRRHYAPLQPVAIGGKQFWLWQRTEPTTSSTRP